MFPATAFTPLRPSANVKRHSLPSVLQTVIPLLPEPDTTISSVSSLPPLSVPMATLPPDVMRTFSVPSIINLNVDPHS